MAQNYDALDMQELLRESERLEQGQGGDFMSDLVRMPEKAGFVVVRILPPARGKKLWCATRIHKINRRNLHCPRVQIKTQQDKVFWRDADPKCPCPVCKYNSELWKEMEGADEEKVVALKKQATDVKAFDRYYYNCIVRQQTDPKTGEVQKNVGPKILSVGVQLHDRIVRAITGDKKNEEPGLGDITDIRNGRDLKIIKAIRPGKDSFPEYNESKFQDPSPLGDPDQVEQWLASLHDLAALRVLKPLDEMKLELKKHLGIIKNDETGFDINEFRKPASPPQSLEEQVHQATREAHPPVVDTPTPSSKSEPIVAQDFLDELKKIKP
jgi:hypothetical protein